MSMPNENTSLAGVACTGPSSCSAMRISGAIQRDAPVRVRLTLAWVESAKLATPKSASCGTPFCTSTFPCQKRKKRARAVRWDTYPVDVAVHDVLAVYIR